MTDLDLVHTPFNVPKSAEQAVQFGIDPSFGLTRARYGWFSNGTRFDSSLFSEVEAGIRVATTATGTDEARIHSAFAGQYVSQALAQPGLGLVIDDSNVSTSNGQTTLSHGEVHAGAFWWDSANNEVDTGLGYKWDSTGWEFFVRSQGSHIGDSPIAQGDFIEPYDDTGPSNKVRTPADGFVGNWPYAWYNEAPLGGAILDKDCNELVEVVRASVSGRPSLDTPNLPVQLVVRNAGTAQSLGVELGGMQYTTYGGAGVVETRPTYGAAQPGSANVTTVVNSPIDPTGQPGDPLYAVQRESGERDLELRLARFCVDSNQDIIVYFWDEFDPGTALTNESWESTYRLNAAETKTRFDRSATAYSPATAVFAGIARIQGGSGPQDIITEIDVEDRVPIDATRVVTAVDTGADATVAFSAEQQEGY